jgi:hypothetical protein
MKRAFFFTAALLAASLVFTACPSPSSGGGGENPPPNGILTLNGFPEGASVTVNVYNHSGGIATQAALDSAMANPVAAAAGSGSPLDLKKTSNGTQAFDQDGTFLVVVTANGEVLFKDQVPFAKGCAAFSYGGLTNKSDLPSDLKDGSLIITGFPEGASVLIKIYGYGGAVDSQAALDSAMAAAPIAEGTISGSGELTLTTPDGQPFDQDGTFLVVATESGTVRFKTGVPFTNGGGAIVYNNLAERSGLPPDPPDEKPLPGQYAEQFWGEWINISTGDTWYISGSGISVNGSPRPGSLTLQKQSAQVAKVSGDGSPYLLFASRTANATLRGKVIPMDNSSGVSSGAARGLSLGSLPPLIIRDPKQPNKEPVIVQPDQGTGDFDAGGFIFGDWLEIRPGIPEDPGTPDETIPPIPVPPLPAPPPQEKDTTAVYEPPVVPIPVVTEGVNVKASLRPQDDSADSTRLYADGTSMNFVLEIENIGTQDCTAATYALEYNNARLVINDPAPNRRLGTLAPKSPEREKEAYTKSIPLTITGIPLTGNSAFADTEIKVNINDTIAKKTWNDSVYIRYNRAKIPFRIRSEYPVQGIIKVPGGMAHYFKTEVTPYGYCAFNIDLP